MKIETTRFGIIEINENFIINFPKGIPGFEKIHRFVTIPTEGTEHIHWLQAVEEPVVALLVIDPFKYFEGYSCDIPDTDIKELEIRSDKELLLVTTVTVPRENPTGATTNLVAPIVINTRLNRAKQVILNNSPYNTRHRLFPDTKTNHPGNNTSTKTPCAGGV